MEANKLMTGDWVLIKRTPSCEYPYKICSINNYSILGEDYADWIEVEAGEEINLEDIKPIPLTAEILEKNGFTLKKADMYFPNDGYIWFDSIENNELVEIYIYDKPINGVRVLTKITNDCKAHGGVNKVHSCEIENVHELQHALRLCGIDKEIVL